MMSLLNPAGFIMALKIEVSLTPRFSDTHTMRKLVAGSRAWA